MKSKVKKWFIKKDTEQNVWDKLTYPVKNKANN
jgi:hypothetical protein